MFTLIVFNHKFLVKLGHNVSTLIIDSLYITAIDRQIMFFFSFFFFSFEKNNNAQNLK